MSVKTYTLRDIGYSCGESLILPFEVDVKEEEILEKVIHLFSTAKFYERELLVVDEYGYIVINCLYEGKEEYYKFTLKFEIFRLKYNTGQRIYYKNLREIEDGQWMAKMNIESEHGPLLEELIEIKSLSRFFEDANLESYVYKL